MGTYRLVNGWDNKLTCPNGPTKLLKCIRTVLHQRALVHILYLYPLLAMRNELRAAKAGVVTVVFAGHALGEANSVIDCMGRGGVREEAESAIARARLSRGAVGGDEELNTIL